MWDGPLFEGKHDIISLKPIDAKTSSLLILCILDYQKDYYVVTENDFYLQENNIYNRITQYKPVFVEPKGKMDFQDVSLLWSIP